MTLERKTECCPGGGGGKAAAKGSSAVCCGPGEGAPKGLVLGMAESPCCPATEAPGGEVPGYRVWPFVEGWLETPAGAVPRVAYRLEAGDVLGRWQMRWGIGRERYRIAPGLYAFGTPGPESPVLVTANYKMTFDVLRRDTAGVDAWVLVLETHGINVWCAAGKGTFGTAEVIRRVRFSGLARVVSHRKLVLPQLGAPGVSAREVLKGCGFQVIYGPVRARDIRAFLAAGMHATAEMRGATFPMGERLALAPVEIVMMLKPALWAALALFLLGGVGPGWFSLGGAWQRGLGGVETLVGAVLAGAVVTPVLLPWLPGRAFSGKGAVAGLALALWGAVGNREGLGWGETFALFLALPAAASYVAMNFTGATPFTSPSGVEREMRAALPWQAGATVLAGVFWIASAF